MSTPLGSSQFFLNAAQEGGQSLRFEDGDTAYLSFTPASAGNRKTWTWSGWVKRGDIDTGYSTFWSAGVNAGARAEYGFQSDNLYLGLNPTGSSWNYVRTNAVFRDHSAWYHMVFAVDMTQSTSTDRVKCWVNGIAQTFSSYSVPAQNTDLPFNNNVAHYVGSYLSGAQPFDGYLANVCFIDGTALTPTSFGEYQDTLWKPKSDADIQSLTFGTNGFYLPFKQTTEAEGFSTVTYTGNGGTQAIEGVGFEPDLVWFKKRASGTNRDHMLFDTVRGVGNRLRASQTTSESFASDELQSFDSNGFMVGSSDSENGSGNRYVAWCWDAGSGSAASNTDGSITSTVKANTAKGFSIVSYTGNNTSGATVGHGLGVEPELIIVKNRDTATNWAVWNTSLSSGQVLTLNTTNAASTPATAYWDDANNTSSVFALGTNNETNDTDDYIGYCFHSVSGYSDIGSYTGTGASGNAVTTGFAPAFVMIKCIDDTGNWHIFDSTRDSNGDLALFPNSSNAESSGWYPDYFQFTSNGFEVGSGGIQTNASGDTYIYMAFADTRDATFFGDTSGNGNNWTPNALNNTDVMLDNPVTGGNFATLNPLDNTGQTLSEGNLKFYNNASSHKGARGNFGMASGQWYFECTMSSISSGDQQQFGLARQNVPCPTNGSAGNTFMIYSSGGNPSNIYIYNDGTSLGVTAQSVAVGDVFKCAYDADTGKLWLGKNSDWYNSSGAVDGSANPATGTNPTMTLAESEPLVAWVHSYSNAGTYNICNFGQDSSFAGNKTAQGNTDDNGYGDFYYAPPSGFLALATSNLPAATITAPDEYFNTVLYSGDGTSSNAITGVNFQPDFTWIKGRNFARNHVVFDSVRNNGGSDDYLHLITNGTNAEQQQTDGDGLLSLDSDGFTVGYNNNVTFNNSGDNYVSWNWLAGGTAVSNTSGSITSQVSANTDAGFSVVSYTGTGSQPETVGHGLGVTPNFIIVKDRDAATNWHVFHSGVMPYTTDGKFMRLNTTDALLTDGSANVWYAGDFTSTVFGVGTANGVSGRDYIAYCFSEVESYSKIGSYTGNGSADGTFVHCGFRPAWVMVKVSSTTENWVIFDNKRSEYNLSQLGLYPNTSGAEVTISTNGIDMLSNGFKLKGTGSRTNGSGQTYIFLAFAEVPFKSANAR